VHKRTIPAAERVEFVSGRMSYIILRGCWCYIIVLNAHALTEHKTDYVTDSFYKELEFVFDEFLKHHMKMTLEEFYVKVGREDIFKMKIGKESLHEIINEWTDGSKICHI
jgi:hypothetical protein